MVDNLYKYIHVSQRSKVLYKLYKNHLGDNYSVSCNIKNIDVRF